MSIFGKLLGLALIEELTETAWWTETVFRELAQDNSDERAHGPEDSGAAMQRSDELV